MGWGMSVRGVVVARRGSRGRDVQVSLGLSDRGRWRHVREAHRWGSELEAGDLWDIFADIAVCTAASACQSSLQTILASSGTTSTPGLNTSLTCNTLPTVYSESQMTCNVIQGTLQGVFPGTSILTISRSLNASLTPGGTSALRSAGLTYGDGVGWAQLWYDGVEQFYCSANSCAQTTSSNGSTWVCGGLSCTCRPNTTFCGGVSTFVDSISTMRSDHLLTNSVDVSRLDRRNQHPQRTAHYRLSRRRTLYLQSSPPSIHLWTGWPRTLVLLSRRVRAAIRRRPGSRHR